MDAGVGEGGGEGAGVGEGVDVGEVLGVGVAWGFLGAPTPSSPRAAAVPLVLHAHPLGNVPLAGTLVVGKQGGGVDGGLDEGGGRGEGVT